MGEGEEGDVVGVEFVDAEASEGDVEDEHILDLQAHRP